ncbi:MAG: hypothetical protein JWO38_6427 [Gemmataceae bacterium]|nr:hypothetical protein [Gemmataceae bacterium]
MNRLRVVALGWALSAVPAAAAAPDPKELTVPAHELSKARELVRKLGSEVFRDREDAQDALAKMGRLARPALAEALGTDPNPEVRARSAQLLPRAEAADLQARIDTFLADADGKFDHDLPGWALFRKEAGADRLGRELYVEVLKSPTNLELLTALGVSNEAGGRAVADRRLALFLQANPGAFGRGFVPATPSRPQQPSLADVAVLLLAETAVPTKDIPRPGPFAYITGAQFVQHQAPMSAINNPGSTPHAEAYRRVFARWLDSRTAPEDLNNIAYIANNFKQLKEAGPLLRRVVTTDGVQSHAKAQAMIFLYQRGKDELPAIRAQLKNDTAINQRLVIAPNVIIDAQIRDVALALCLHNENQDLKKYGFEFQPGFNPAQVAQNYWGYGFTSDETRTTAFKKWNEFEAQKKKDGKGADQAPPPKAIGENEKK